MRRVLTVVFVVGALAALVAVVYASSGGEDVSATARENARRVHCLDAAHRQRLVDIAKTIETARSDSTVDRIRPSSKPSSPVKVEEWEGDDFDKACNALVALTNRHLLDPKPDQSRLASLLSNPALNVLLGGLLTGAVGYWTGAKTAERDRGRALADALNGAAAEYNKAARAYVQAREGSVKGLPPADELELRRTDLWFAIDRQRFPADRKRVLRDRLDAAHVLFTRRKADGYTPTEALAGLDRLNDELAGTSSAPPPTALPGPSAGGAP